MKEKNAALSRLGNREKMTSSTTQQYQTTTPVPGRMPEIDPHQRKLDAAKDSWTLLTKQIPQWSKENFGDQKGINHIS